MKEVYRYVSRVAILMACLAMNAVCLAQGRASSNVYDERSSEEEDEKSRRGKWVLERRFDLGQNFPNPFSSSETTSIDYRIAGDPGALLIVYSSDGRKQMTIPLALDKTRVLIQGGQLSAGTYIYALFVYGRIVEKKKFILKP